MTTKSDSGMSGCHADATASGSCLWRALDVTVSHSYTHGLQSWNNTQVNTHAYCTCMPAQERVFNGSHKCRHTNTLRNFTGKSSWQIKEYTYRDEPFRTFENLPKDVFLKTNYPCGCVKEWPLLFPVHIRNPQIIVGFFFFPGPCEQHAVHLTFKAALPKEEIISKIHFYCFQLSEGVSNYMTTCHVRRELYLTILLLVIFSLMTMFFFFNLSNRFWNAFMNQGCVHLSHPIKYHVILELNLKHERFSLDSYGEELLQWHSLSDHISQ